MRLSPFSLQTFEHTSFPPYCQGPVLDWGPGSLPGPGDWPRRDEHQGRAGRGHQIPQQLPWVKPCNLLLLCSTFSNIRLWDSVLAWWKTEQKRQVALGVDWVEVGQISWRLIGADLNTGLWLVWPSAQFIWPHVNRVPARATKWGWAQGETTHYCCTDISSLTSNVVTSGYPRTDAGDLRCLVTRGRGLVGGDTSWEDGACTDNRSASVTRTESGSSYF